MRQTPEIHFGSYNPYESTYPGLRVVSRETLHLIKALRAQGYLIKVVPDNGTPLNYLMAKGIRDVLSDPIYAIIISIPINLILNLISNWVYDQLKRQPKKDEVNVILEIDDNGNKVRYTQSGEPISDDKFKLLLASLEKKRHQYEEAQKLVPPDEEHFLPIQLEHTGKIVGWSKGLIPDDEKRGMLVDGVKVIDDDTWKRIQTGELKGFSVAGLVTSATCMTCNQEYVECNHIAGTKYDEKMCAVRINKVLPAEISIVKEPVQQGALIERR